MAPRNDIAIYTPSAFAYYEDQSHVSGSPRGGGGAAIQTTLLASELARRGVSVAHILYPIKRLADPLLQVEVIERKPRIRGWGPLGRLADNRRLWLGLSAADARLYLFRGGDSELMIGACFCMLRRRRLVLSAANDLDFVRRPDRSRLGQAMYRAARRRARCVVVQTAQQLTLAQDAMAGGTTFELIPSFAEPVEGQPAATKPESFLWAGRLVNYKQPLRYIELARAVPEARFVMLASETAESPPDLIRQVADAANTTPNLELRGRQRREQTLDLIGRSVAVVVTSDFEGMPNVFLEAWSRGVPVLSLHFDPDGKIARDGLGLFAESSSERFVEAAKRLWRDAELRREIGDRARSYVANVHAPEAVGDRWAEVLSDALG